MVLSFNNQWSLKCSIRCTFLVKHSGQKLIFVLTYTFSANYYLILDVIWSSFNNHICFDSSVLHCSWLKSLLWFANHILKDVFERPNFILVTLYELFSTSAQYIRFSVRHWFCNGQFSLIQQLQPYLMVLGLNSLLLSDEIIDDMLLMQQ